MESPTSFEDSGSRSISDVCGHVDAKACRTSATRSAHDVPG